MPLTSGTRRPLASGAVRSLRVAVVIVAAAVLSFAGVTADVAPVVAAEDACEGGYRTSGGYELFDVDDDIVPPPLRGTGWDCAARTLGSDVDEPDAARSVQYILYWVDIDAERALDILARFEQAGWTDGDEGTIASNSAGRSENGSMGVAELRQWDPLPGAINVRFGDEQTGHDIIHFVYGDGVLATPDPGLPDRPVLMIDVIVTSRYDATGAADPSVLSGLRTLAEAMPSSTQALVLGGTAVFLTLLVAFPGYLLDRVLEHRWARVRAWWRARRPARLPAVPRATAPSWLVWPGFAAASLIACFVDPSFGVNALSLRLYLAMFASLTLVNVVGWAVAAAVMRRLDAASRPRMVFRWGSLVLVAIAVLIGRMLQFEPGAVFGIVAGLVFAVSLSAARDALVVLLGTGTALALAVVAWLGYSMLAPLAEGAHNPVLLGAVETLSGVVVEGVSTLPLALLPLLALDGAVVFAWRKWAWALAYLVGVAAFGFVMLTLPEAWGEVRGDYLHWLLVFAGFAVVATGVWVADAVLRRRTRVRASARAAAAPAASAVAATAASAGAPSAASADPAPDSPTP